MPLFKPERGLVSTMPEKRGNDIGYSSWGKPGGKKGRFNETNPRLLNFPIFLYVHIPKKLIVRYYLSASVPYRKRLIFLRKLRQIEVLQNRLLNVRSIVEKMLLKEADYRRDD
jgi:hypothetical protein